MNVHLRDHKLLVSCRLKLDSYQIVPSALFSRDELSRRTRIFIFYYREGKGGQVKSRLLLGPFKHRLNVCHYQRFNYRMIHFISIGSIASDHEYEVEIVATK